MRTETLTMDCETTHVQTLQTRAHVQALMLKAKEMIDTDPVLSDEARKAWQNIFFQIEEHAKANMKKRPHYEVVHLTETARAWFLCDIAEDMPVHVASERTIKALTEGFR